MPFYTDDPVRDAERYTQYLDEKLERRPKCDCCGAHIQDDEALHYKGIYICLECIENHTEFIEVD